eukprot:TRINITY_DN5235_c0_g1_i2.p1 TRINITY_DN5235_c0_g1~~TRINITY_DN5235_c0_g1_i2.p1  ORF type:complete len:104 (-),score=11.21 TRINITY_DN5235_c0_g1_i2:123-434(-)
MGSPPDTTTKEVTDASKRLSDGSLFYGSFNDFGGIWFAITFWSTFGCGLVYLISGGIAVLISKRYKSAVALTPIFFTIYGMVCGFSIGSLAGIYFFYLLLFSL